MPTNPELVLSLALILVLAKVGGDLAVRLRQPPVVAELLVGIVLGNLPLVGIHAAEPLRTEPGLAMLAELGVLILMFEVGLASTVREMLHVGWSSLLVAVLGVVTPLLIGWLALSLITVESSSQRLFVAASLCATSVGITARVLRDLGRERSLEARVILGAAVIDDVLGVVLLGVVAGLIGGGGGGGATFSFGHIVRLCVTAALFLVGSLLIGARVSPLLFRAAARLRSRDVMLALSLALCFGLAWGAERVGLAAIVGAFAAGLLLEEAHFGHFIARGEPTLEQNLHPLSSVLVPIFFIRMGLETDLRALGSGHVLALAAVLTLVAIVGKQACSLGVIGRGIDRLTVGIGMIPRGEVGLIFAGLGASLTAADGRPVIGPELYAALVTMVVVTTVVTPPLLKWRLARPDRPRAVSAGPGAAPSATRGGS